MKLRHAIILGISVIVLSACNFTLAADVTPPPDYVSPTPMPTLGPLFPASAPDINNGAAIYVEKCAPCHGDMGLGDGEQGKQLPVPVAALALPETARKASPASWFTMVSQGNLDRFMPPFTSLSEQERWDVVSYALTLHSTADQIATGKNLFESNCKDCAVKFSNLKMMSALSDNDLVQIIKSGRSDIPAFGSKFTDEQAFAVAAYLRTLTFALPATPAPASLTETSSTPVEVTALAEVTRDATNIPGNGNVSGSINNKTGAALSSDLKVTLRGYEHGTDSNATPQEIATFNAKINPDGTYDFANVEMPENRIYRAEITLDGITYQSQFGIVTAGMIELALSPITVYAITDDYSALHMDALQMYFDYANEQNVQMLAVYSFTNTSDKAVIVKVKDGKEIPFIKLPKGSMDIGYQESPDNPVPFIFIDKTSFAILPSESAYGLIAFASLAKEKKIRVDQAVVLPVAEVMLLVPEGVAAEGTTLTDGGPHEFRGGKFNLYTSTAIDANGSISFTLSGAPKNTAVAPDFTQNLNLVIGGLAFGAVLIMAGVWMYWRKRLEEDNEEGGGIDNSESVMDAIIALDDLHQAGKLSKEAYKKRRDELKNMLKRKS